MVVIAGVFFVKEHAAKQEERAKRFGEASVNQSVVNAETLNNLYNGQVSSCKPHFIRSHQLIHRLILNIL